MLSMRATGRGGGCFAGYRQLVVAALQGMVVGEGGLLGIRRTWCTRGWVSLVPGQGAVT